MKNPYVVNDGEMQSYTILDQTTVEHSRKIKSTRFRDNQMAVMEIPYDDSLQKINFSDPNVGNEEIVAKMENAVINWPRENINMPDSILSWSVLPD
jgi:hypothetical protein